MMRRFCNWILKLRAKRVRVIYDRAGESPYLTRCYLLGGPRTMEMFDQSGAPKPDTAWLKLPVNVFLHKFHRGDDDLALHNHPWRWSFAIILAGGYREERRKAYTSKTGEVYYRVVTRFVLPFTINVIRGDDFHRVDLLEEDCWSIFVAGPRSQSWGFWDRVTNVYTPWREFIQRVRDDKLMQASERAAVRERPDEHD